MEMRLIDSRRKRPWLLYVATLVAAVLAALFLYYARGASSDVSADGSLRESYATDSLAAVGAVSAFAVFATERRATRDATLDHAYTAEGLRRLAAVLHSVRRRDATLGPPRYADVAADLLEAAAAIQLDERSTTHADILRAAMIQASSAIADIQRARYPNLGGAVTELRHAAKSIRADRELLLQAEAVQRFFDRASDVLRGMAEVGL
jgi:hypothetical protein